MVKGLSKRVVVVKSPANTMFEEAIFILKEETIARGVNADQIVKEACSAAEGYTGKIKKRRVSPAIPFIALGASLTGVIWVISTFL